jgi:hypothetical protein
MFNRLKTYHVYAKRGSTEPLEDVILVQQGFNLFAFLFTGLWALFNRLWFLLLIIIAFNVALNFVGVASGAISEVKASLISLIFKLWVGFEGDSFKNNKIENGNYVLFDIVSGYNETSALRRFYDKYLLDKHYSDSIHEDISSTDSKSFDNDQVNKDSVEAKNINNLVTP